MITRWLGNRLIKYAMPHVGVNSLKAFMTAQSVKEYDQSLRLVIMSLEGRVFYGSSDMKKLVPKTIATNQEISQHTTHMYHSAANNPFNNDLRAGTPASPTPLRRALCTTNHEPLGH